MGSKRSPAVVILLTILTFGIFGFVWMYKFNQEVDEAGQFRFRAGKRMAQIIVFSALLVTLPVAIVLFYAFLYRSAVNVSLLQQRLKITPPMKGGPVFAVSLIPVVGFWIYQGILQAAVNRVWARIPPGMAVLPAPQAPPTAPPYAFPRPAAPPAYYPPPNPWGAPYPAAPARPVSPAAAEQKLECPRCGNHIVVRVTPGVPTVAACGRCGFSAPYG